MPASNHLAPILRDVDGGGDCEPMLELLKGNRDEEQLGYEEWAKPCKLTGGTVCIRIEPFAGGPERFVTVNSDTMRVHEEAAGTTSGLPAAGVLRNIVRHCPHRLEPVHREATPFEEVGHEGA